MIVMGMFDSLKINSEKLPVPENEKILLKNIVFQTKDLERSLLLYFISDSGELLLAETFDEENPEDKIPVSFMEGEIDLNEIKIYTKIAFHGYLVFYTLIEKTWYEFKAKFTDDKLVSIERISERV
jgi:hypothetical protein